MAYLSNRTYLSYFFILLFASGFFPLQAQEEENVQKYQSLFWKIEGKGMEKPSYLYGTMHVSYKIAYHLNDEFYQALQEVDQVALETNPEDWMDLMLDQVSGGGYGMDNELYSSFAPHFPDEKNFQYILKQNNELVNGILYRNSDAQQNFQEETYLDMFIFQAGSKQKKPVLALEDIEEADQLTKKAALNAYDDKKEFSPWLKKKLQKKGIVELTEDAYRDKNLDLIDSLNEDYYPELYNEYMLYERNRNIVEAMDSVMQKGTVFVGIGAAHLPGKKGVIEYLREEGYSVTAIEGDLTPKGINIKDNFETNFLNRPHQTYFSSDNFYSVDLPEQLYEFSYNGLQVGLSLDITNGAYFLSFRTPTFSKLNKDKFGLDEIEDMLYENIPGKIEQQNRINFQGYPAIEIKNKTKSGEHQKYLIVETPLEIIVFKLGGKKDYALQYGSKYFNSLKLKKEENVSKTVQPFYGDFEIEIPGSPIMDGNHLYASEGSPLMIQSMGKDGGFYFAQALVYHDYRYLESDKFELEYLHKIWYDQIDTSAQSIHSYAQRDDFPFPHSYSTSTTKDGDRMDLFSIKKGPRYYMMGTVGVDSISSKKYFDSFQFKPYLHKDEKYELQIDTSLFFEVISSVESPPYFDFYGMRQSKDTLSSKYQSASFKTPYKEVIHISYNKYHSFYEVEHLDSIWNRIERKWEEDDHIISKKEKGTLKKGQPFYAMELSRKNSTKSIHNYYVLNHGVMYLLQYDHYSDEPLSTFIDTFFQTFILADTLIGRSPFHKKSSIFFDNIHSSDSLTRANTLKAYEYIVFDKKDVQPLIETIENYEFEEKEMKIKIGLLEELGNIEDPRVFPYLKNKYIQSEDNSLIQLEVINALAKNPSENNFKSILTLLKTDIPLSTERNIYETFRPLMDSTAVKYGNILFPELMDYSSIPEYKNWVYQLAAHLKDKGHLKTKILKKYKGLLLNEMKIEYKRKKASELNKKSDRYYGSSYNSSPSLLDEYISLLAPFHKEEAVSELFNKIKTLENPYTKTILLAQLAKHNSYVDPRIMTKLAENPKTRLDLYRQLKKLKQLDKFPKAYKNQQAIAEAYLYDYTTYPSIDSIVFLKDSVLIDEEDEYIIYFFKSKKKDDGYGYSGNENKSEEWGIQYIAYKLDKEKPIQYKSSYSKSKYTEMDFDDAKEMNKFEKDATEAVLYKKRRRVNTYRGGYGGGYDY